MVQQSANNIFNSLTIIFVLAFGALREKMFISLMISDSKSLGGRYLKGLNEERKNHHNMYLKDSLKYKNYDNYQ